MSQVVKSITASDLGERKPIRTYSPLFQDVFSVKETIEGVPHLVAKLYRIGVTIGAQAWINDIDTINEVDAVEQAILRTKRSVIEAIFGEFREDILRIRGKLYDRDFNQAVILLDELERKMFEP